MKSENPFIMLFSIQLLMFFMFFSIPFWVNTSFLHTKLVIFKKPCKRTFEVLLPYEIHLFWSLFDLSRNVSINNLWNMKSFGRINIYFIFAKLTFWKIPFIIFYDFVYFRVKTQKSSDGRAEIQTFFTGDFSKITNLIREKICINTSLLLDYSWYELKRNVN